MNMAKAAWVACLCAGLLAGPALAQVAGGGAATAPAGQPAAAASIPDPDKVVCKSEPVLGSRFPKKVCLTNAQWHQQELDSRRMLERLQGARVPSSG